MYMIRMQVYDLRQWLRPQLTCKCVRYYTTWNERYWNCTTKAYNFLKTRSSLKDIQGEKIDGRSQGNNRIQLSVGVWGVKTNRTRCFEPELANARGESWHLQEWTERHYHLPHTTIHKWMLSSALALFVFKRR